MKRILPVLVLAVLVTSASHAEDLVSWKGAPGAAYYQGFVTSGTGRVKIRTASTWLILHESAQLPVVVAYDAQGKKLGVITAERKPSGAAETAPPLAVEAPPAEEPAPVEESPPAVEPAPVEPVAQTPEETPPPEETSERRWRASLDFLFGKESVTLDSGRSQLDAAQGLGATGVGLTWAGAESPWSASLSSEFHRFEKKVTLEQSGGVESETTVEAKSYQVGLLSGYDLADGAPRLSLCAGLVLGKTPVFLDDLDSTGSNEVSGASFMGLLTGLQYSRKFAAADAVESQLLFAPLALSGAKSLSEMAIAAAWLHDLTTRFHSTVGLDFRRTAVETTLDCAGCDSTSQSTDQIVAFRLGVGARF